MGPYVVGPFVVFGVGRFGLRRFVLGCFVGAAFKEMIAYNCSMFNVSYTPLSILSRVKNTISCLKGKCDIHEILEVRF